MPYASPLLHSRRVYSDGVIGNSPHSHHPSSFAEDGHTQRSTESISMLRAEKTMSTATVASNTSTAALCTPNSNGSSDSYPGYGHTRHRGQAYWGVRHGSNIASEEDAYEEDQEGMVGSVRLSRHIPQREGIDMSVCSFNLTDALELSQPVCSQASLNHGCTSMNSTQNDSISNNNMNNIASSVRHGSHTPPPPLHRSLPVTAHPNDFTQHHSLAAFLSLPELCPSGHPAAAAAGYGVVGFAGLSHRAALASSSSGFSSLSDSQVSDDSSHLTSLYNDMLADKLTRHNTGVTPLVGTPFGTPLSRRTDSYLGSAQNYVSNSSRSSFTHTSATAAYRDHRHSGSSSGRAYGNQSHVFDTSVVGEGDQQRAGEAGADHGHDGCASARYAHRRRLCGLSGEVRGCAMVVTTPRVGGVGGEVLHFDCAQASPSSLPCSHGNDRHASSASASGSYSYRECRDTDSMGDTRPDGSWHPDMRVSSRRHRSNSNSQCRSRSQSQSRRPPGDYRHHRTRHSGSGKDMGDGAGGAAVPVVDPTAASSARTGRLGRLMMERHASLRRATTAAASVASGPLLSGELLAWPRLRHSPASASRLLPTNPECVLDAPDFPSDAPQLIHWGSNNKLIVGMANTVYVWDAETRGSQKLVELPAPAQIRCVNWIHKCLCVALSANDGATVIFDCRNESTLRTVRVPHGETVRAMAVHGPLLALGSSATMSSGGCCDGNSNGGAGGSYPANGYTRATDGLPGASSRTVGADRLRPHIIHGGYCPYPGDDTGGPAACTRVYDLRLKNALIARFAAAGGSEIQTLRYCHAEPFYLASGEVGGSVRVWDARRPDAARYVYRAVHRGAVTALLWNPDHRSRLFTGGADGVLTVIDTHAPTRLLGRVPTLDDNDDNDEDSMMYIHHSSQDGHATHYMRHPGTMRSGTTEDNAVNSHGHSSNNRMQTYPYTPDALSVSSLSTRLADDDGRHCIHRAVNTMSPVTGIVCHGGANDEMLSTHRAQGQLQLRKMSNFHLLRVCKTRNAEADILCVTPAPDRERVCAAQTDETLTFWRVFERPASRAAGGGHGEEDCCTTSRRHTPSSVMEEHIR